MWSRSLVLANLWVLFASVCPDGGWGPGAALVVAASESTKPAASGPTTELERRAVRDAYAALFGRRDDDTARMMSMGDMDPHGAFRHFVLVQDQYLHKQAAIATWSTSDASNGSDASDASDASNPNSRRLTKHTKKKKKKKKEKGFNAKKACFTVRKAKLKGGTLKGGRSRVKSWGECCEKCTLQASCGWWSFKAKKKDGRGKGECLDLFLECSSF